MRNDNKWPSTFEAEVRQLRAENTELALQVLASEGQAVEAYAEAKALRRDYSLMQIDRNNLRSLLDATEAKVDELHDKLDGVEAEAKALRARVQELEAALQQICNGNSLSPMTLAGVQYIARAALQQEGK
jgi:chromosome segregation ATPase